MSKREPRIFEFVDEPCCPACHTPIDVDGDTIMEYDSEIYTCESCDVKFKITKHRAETFDMEEVL